MQDSNATAASGRLHAMTTISASLHGELKEMATKLNGFSDSPSSQALSPGLGMMYRAASFCGFWGVANYLGALRELASSIEAVPVESVERAEFIDRVKTLAGGINALGLYLRDLAAGSAVSYAALNEQFARVLRKARPALLELPVAQQNELLFMPAPPSLEVDAHWSPAEGASRQALVEALSALLGSTPDEQAIRSVARTNPYRSLSGLLDSGACQHKLVLQPHILPSVLAEAARVRELLSSGEPLTPPTPDAFLFSRLMFSLASSPATDGETVMLRRRYALTKPGANLASMHDVARKFVEGIKRFHDGYTQAALSRTPAAVVKMAASVAADSHRLESPAFSTFAALMSKRTSAWPAEGPSTDEWVQGAATVLLLREAAETWGHQGPQDELAGLADLMAATGELFACQSMQATVRAAALQKACDSLALDFVEVNKVIEGSLRSAGPGDLEPPVAARVAEQLGARVRTYLTTVNGVMLCLDLPQAALFASRAAEQADDAGLWASSQARAGLFEALARLQLFMARLRPASMLDMEPDEQGDLVVVEEVAPESTDVDSVLPRAGHGLASTEEVSVIDRGDSQSCAVESELHAEQLGEDVEGPKGTESSVNAPDMSGSQARLDVGVADPGSFEPVDGSTDWEEAPAIEISDDIGDPVEAVLLEPEDEAGPVVGLIAAPEEWAHAANESQADVPVMQTPLPAETSEVALQLDALHDDDSWEDGFYSAAPTVDLSSLDPEELRREFLDAQAGRSSQLDSDDDELLAIMFEESWECMDAIDSALSAAGRGGASAGGTVPVARRFIHTLKGVCRTVGLDAPGATLHAMEDRLEMMPDDGIALSQLVQPFVAAMVIVRGQLEAARASFHGASVGAESALAAPEPDAQAPTLQTAPDALEFDDAPSEVDAVQPNVDPLEESNSPTSSHEILPSDQVVESPSQGAPRVVAPTPAAGGSVRIQVRTASSMGETSGKVLMASRRALEDQVRVTRAMRELNENLQRMAPAIRELELMAATSIASSQAQGQTQGFDPLELDRYTQMQEVVRRLGEAFEDTIGSAGALSDGLRTSSVAEQDRAELADELQRGASELLLVPVSTQLGRLERVVAKACSDAGRRASLMVEPGTRVPAAALDKLMPVFEHIVRNAVAHGIEAGAERLASGKSPVGRIVIGAPSLDVAEGGVVRICVRDDGAGIDLERVLAVAIRRGLVQGGVTLSEDATRELLFMPGFSTAGSVSELAGRGVGLDVVRSSVSSLGGVVSVSSERGKGTEFTLTLPTDAASMSVIPVTSAGFKCLLPLTLVRRIVPVSAGVVVDVEAGKATIAGVEHPLIDMSRRVPSAGAVSRAGRGHLVLMRESNAIVLVDAVGQQTRVVVKPLGPFVRDIPGMVAGTTMAAGGVGLVVNPLQLTEISRAKVTQERVISTAPRVMVVDDSTTVRHVTSRFLKRCGMSVDVARDGLEALQLLAKGATPDVFLFDLEMPGMGGFELIAEVRRKAQFKDTPIVVITSRTAEKHRERATQLGATAYLAKPYEDAQLQQVLSQFVRVAA